MPKILVVNATFRPANKDGKDPSISAGLKSTRPKYIPMNVPTKPIAGNKLGSDTATLLSFSELKIIGKTEPKNVNIIIKIEKKVIFGSSLIEVNNWTPKEEFLATKNSANIGIKNKIKFLNF